MAGQPAPEHLLANIPRLITAYYAVVPDPDSPEQRVSFGTSGHRGSSLSGSFNEAHIVAISAAICDYRQAAGIRGPLFLGIDTHALSEPAAVTAIEVFAGRGLELRLAPAGEYTPTPAVSHAILQHNRGDGRAVGDGVLITPSHNPPEDGGLKYNPPTGGPAESPVTAAIEKRANELLPRWRDVPRISLQSALALGSTQEFDFRGHYVRDLSQVIDMAAIAGAGLRLGVDPLGGAALGYWGEIAEVYRLDLEVVNRHIDPTFRFMRLDSDGRIRMDCSSPHAMAGLIELGPRFDLAFANDPDADRHGIVTRTGLLNPNHYLAAAIDYLFEHRPDWRAEAAIGKTLVSSSMIDRVAEQLGRQVEEVPVGFKWFVDGLMSERLGFAGEESAGASFLRRDGRVWTTDKDGIILNLLAAEMLAVTGKDPGQHYRRLEERFGKAVYRRIDAPATRAQKAALARLSADSITAEQLAGEPILSKITRAPANNAPIDGVKVTTRDGWFAARPSGTEEVYKIYAESFIGAEQLERILKEAQAMVDEVLGEPE